MTEAGPRKGKSEKAGAGAGFKRLVSSSSLNPVVTSAVSPSRSSGSQRRSTGAKVGFALSAAMLGALLAPGQEHLLAPGSMNPGHEELACESCHVEAQGSIRQQLQANARYLLGLRPDPVDFGRKDVDNGDCLACHRRPFDRHPVFRFNEPRFAEARKKLAPQLCFGCHSEHTGERVSVQAGYCVQCHDGLEMRSDPLDVSHEKLIAAKRWSTCLGCHDFHGNHVMKTPIRVDQAIAPPRIESYFARGSSPYSKKLLEPASKIRAGAGE